MAQPILTLTTDFGACDHYVGAMKGVILGICPHAQIVDICHQVEPYQIAEGAYTIGQAYEYFPRRTVHVVVVDPGVGTVRRPILIEAAGQFFVGPDNGVLSLIYSREKHKARLIANHKYFRHPVSATFHGRDLFAPVAAHLAAGVAPARMGRLIQDYLQPEFAAPQPTGERTWSGRILKIDRFGNIVTNFHAADFPGPCSVTIGRRKVSTQVRTYAEGGPGQLVMLVGSSGYLEISVNRQSAAQLTACKTGGTLHLAAS